MNALREYLSHLSRIRRAGGVPETSGYGAIENLFNEAGKSLKPKVKCVINPSNKGAGIPDGGLFTPNQFQRSSNDLIEGQLPERGAVEVKSTSEEVDFTADSIQVGKYLAKYRQVLVTNYRDFLLISLDESRQPQKLERFSLAEDETAFWEKADGHRAITDTENERFVDFLKRVMLYRAALAKPEDVAWFLASYARDARGRVEQADLHALDTIRKALEESLGIKFDGEKGEHFFRSTLVQTLFYGIFSAWVLWHKRNRDRRQKFNWKEAVWELKVPMISVLFEQIATPSNLKQLDIVEVLDWTENVLNRVSREEFFAKFAEEHAVQYFYEPFLQAFDPVLRKKYGVWYTPEEIVRYMVERVDRVLRTELNLPDGLADESVYVLDPACGTGAYLVEVLRRINQTLEEKGEDSIRGQKLKKAVMSRVFGFEILPAPFVVSHLQIGLLLEQLGVGFSDDRKERAGVYLTNSLTGWDEHPKKHLPYPEFEQERDFADQIKRESRILVILGNPPYDGFAGVSPEEEMGLVEPYKKGLIKEWGIKKFNLDDLYIRFFRLAERKIAEQTGQGIVCYISNFSYLSDPSFVVMRKKFLSEFDRVWIDNLNGDSRETGKTTPLGKPDPSIFSTEQTKTGIRVGTSIGLFVRRPDHVDGGMAEVGYREFWGTRKREELLESLSSAPPPDVRKSSAFPDAVSDLAATPPGQERRHSLEEIGDGAGEAELRRTSGGGAVKSESKLADETASPGAVNRFSMRPGDVSDDYQSWPLINELCEVNSNGLMEKRGGALIDIDRDELERRMRMYFDKSVSWDELQRLESGLTTDMAGYDARKTRKKLISKASFQPDRVLRYSIRPFETRWCYFSEINPLWNRPRPTLWQHFGKGNLFLVTRPGGVANPEGKPFYFTGLLGDNDSLRGHAYYVPFRLRSGDAPARDENQGSFFGTGEAVTRANLSETARGYLVKLGFERIDDDEQTSALIWYHALAIGYSPGYLTENADGIRQDFPRVPLPANRDSLIASAELGRRVAALLDTEMEVEGVTAGKIRPELRTIGVASRLGGGQLQDDDLRVTAGWGHTGKDGVTMPGKGQVWLNSYTEDEMLSLGSDGMEALGDMTLHIYLNDVAHFRNVPDRVWNYYIGGYQVMKKWLSYREFDLLGRPLSIDEVTEVTNMARRIAALVLMESELNENYNRIKADTFDLSN
ncbi:MAG: N-6 DNA methylase [Chloracidobacterium sp.]|nr:N-6 DNA methylase [Chloracidobacterium sp.]